jgi:hypothetical protein
LQGVISKKKITGGNAKLDYFAGGKDLLTLDFSVHLINLIIIGQNRIGT